MAVGRERQTAVIAPNLGMYLDRPPLAIPRRALADCRNVRVKNGIIERENMGWTPFIARRLYAYSVTHGGTVRPVTLIDSFFERTGAQSLIFGTDKDLYLYDEINEDVTFLTPEYATGTVDVTNGSAVVAGNGTTWLTNIKAGDAFAIGADGTIPPEAGPLGNKTWYEVLSVDNDTQLTLTVNYAEGTLGTQVYSVRKLFLGDLFDYWNTETFPDAQPSGDDLWYATNGVDDVVRWTAADARVTSLSGLGLRCRDLLRWKNTMVYANLVVSGESRPLNIRLSEIATPENVTTGNAAEFTIRDGVDVILVLAILGDNLVIYSERGVTTGQYVDLPLLMVFRDTISGLGPLAGRAVADFGDFHEFIGPDAQYRFDGIGISEINFQVWREILRRQSPDRLDGIVSHFDEENGDLIWAVPLSTDPDLEGSAVGGWVEHYLENVEETDPTPYTFRDFTATSTGFFERLTTFTFATLTQSWASYNFRWNDRFFQAAFPFNLMGTQDGYVMVLSEADDFNGANIESFARFGLRPAWDGNFKGLIKRIEPHAPLRESAAFALSVRLYGTDRAGGKQVLLSDLPYDLTHQGNRFVSPYKVTRFFSTEYHTDGINQPWALEGDDVERTRAGSY